MTAGVTRDRREGDASLAAMRFRLIDTAGLENAQPGSLEDRMRKQTELAVSQADVTMLVIDGRSGLLPDDLFFARQIRKAGANVIVLVNKCEGQAGQSVLAEAWQLGLGEPVPISAAHGDSLSGLYDALLDAVTSLGRGDELFDGDIDDAFDDEQITHQKSLRKRYGLIRKRICQSVLLLWGDRIWANQRL